MAKRTAKPAKKVAKPAPVHDVARLVKAAEMRMAKRLDAYRDGMRAIQDKVNELVSRHNATDDRMLTVERASISFGRTVEEVGHLSDALKQIGQAVAMVFGADIDFDVVPQFSGHAPLRDKTWCEIVGPFVSEGGRIEIAKVEGRNDIGVTAKLRNLSVRHDIAGQAATRGSPTAIDEAVRRAVNAVHASPDLTAPVEEPDEYHDN